MASKLYSERMNSAAPAPDVGQPRAGVTWALLGGSFPNLVQWYNLYAFAVFAPFFRTEFFDPSDGGSLIYVYAIFALTFVMRPIGSWIFGRIAGRRGLRFALVSSVLLMSAGSAVLAISPTQSHVGAWSAGILLLVGAVQGIATGGEYGASAVYLADVAARGRRGFSSSFQTATIVAGQVLAQATLLILLSVVDRAQISAWGWRVAFGLGALAGVMTLVLARRMPSERTRPAAAGLADLFRDGWRPLLWVVLMTSGGTAAFYTFTVTVPSVSREAAFAAGGSDAERASTTAILIAMIVLMLLQPVGGAMSDRIGRKPLLVFFGAAGVVVIGPAVMIAPGLTAPSTLFAVLLVVFVVLTGYLATNTIAKAEAFPPELRALGVGFGYAVSNSLFGGTAPLLYHATATAPWLFSAYVTVLVAVTLAAALVMRTRALSTEV